MLDFNRLLRGFVYAFNGFVESARQEQNIRIELSVTLTVVILGVFCKLASWEWAWILISCAIVIIAEMLNTAIERLTDLVTRGEWHDLARQCKDIAAASVGMAALHSLIAGVWIFGGRLWGLARLS